MTTPQNLPDNGLGLLYITGQPIAGEKSTPIERVIHSM